MIEAKILMDLWGNVYNNVISLTNHISIQYVINIDNDIYNVSDREFGYFTSIRYEDPNSICNLCLLQYDSNPDYESEDDYVEYDADQLAFYRGRMTYNNGEYDKWEMFYQGKSVMICLTEIITETPESSQESFFDIFRYCPTIESVLDGHLTNSTASSSALSSKTMDQILEAFTGVTSISTQGNAYKSGAFTGTGSNGASTSITCTHLYMCGSSSSSTTYNDLSDIYTQMQGQFTDKILLLMPSSYQGNLPGKARKDCFVTQLKSYDTASNVSFFTLRLPHLRLGNSNADYILNYSDNLNTYVDRNYIILWKYINAIDEYNEEYLEPKYIFEFDNTGACLGAKFFESKLIPA